MNESNPTILPLVRQNEVQWSNGYFCIKRTIMGKEIEFNGTDRDQLIKEANKQLQHVMESHNGQSIR